MEQPPQQYRLRTEEKRTLEVLVDCVTDSKSRATPWGQISWEPRLTTGQAGQCPQQPGCSSIGFGQGWVGDRSSWESKTRWDNESGRGSGQQVQPGTAEDRVRDKVHSGDRVGDKAIYLHRPIQEGQLISQDNRRQDLAQVNLQYCTCWSLRWGCQGN